MHEELSYGDNLVGTEHPHNDGERGRDGRKEMRIVAARLETLIADEDELGLMEILHEFGNYHCEAAKQNPTAETQVLKTDSKVVPMLNKGGYAPVEYGLPVTTIVISSSTTFDSKTAC